eukprot:Pgem_evm1s17001
MSSKDKIFVSGKTPWWEMHRSHAHLKALSYQEFILAAKEQVLNTPTFHDFTLEI